MVNPQTGVLVFPRLGGKFIWTLIVTNAICSLQKCGQLQPIGWNYLPKCINREICAKDFNLAKDEMVVKSNGAVPGQNPIKSFVRDFFIGHNSPASAVSAVTQCFRHSHISSFKAQLSLHSQK